MFDVRIKECVKKYKRINFSLLKTLHHFELLIQNIKVKLKSSVIFKWIFGVFVTEVNTSRLPRQDQVR